MVRTLGLISLPVVFLLVAICPGQEPGEISYHDDPKMPEGLKGKRILSVIDAVNSQSPDRIQRLVEEEFGGSFKDIPVDSHVNAFLRFGRSTGGVKFHSIRTYVPENPRTVVIVKDSNFQAWQGISIRFGGAPEYLIVGLGLNPARIPTDIEESAYTEQEFLNLTGTLVKRLCGNDVFSGTVLVAKKENILFSEACGEASKRFHAKNDLDTKFNLGSMNKMFTSTAIVQLVEKGKLSFDESIEKWVDKSWLPEVETSRITIHHLLTHTSGLGSYFNDQFWNGSRALYRSVDDFKKLTQKEQLKFDPGQEFSYSNTGMHILGVVIESVTGQTYFDYIRENIYKPSGMLDSDSFEMDFPVENLAIGYSPEPRSPYKWRNNLYQHVIKGGPAGGGFSTVSDLFKFAQALLSGKLVSKESLKKMWTDHSGSEYGYGFSVREGSKGKVVGHGGGFSGLNGNLDIFVDQDFVVAVLTNYDGAATPLAQRIGELLNQVK